MFYTPHTYVTQIQVGHQPVAQPRSFTYNGTTYMPIWYVMQSLTKMGVKNEWDGRNWKMTTPKNVTVNLKSIYPGQGNSHLYLNGTLVWSVQSKVAVDPNSGKPSTYMPIWNVMQILNRIDMQSTWSHSIWNLTVPAWSTDRSSGSSGSTPPAKSGSGSASGSGGKPPTVLPQPPLPASEVARWFFEKQLFSALQRLPDNSGTSPYNDIAANDPNWGYVHAAIQQHLLTPDSSTHSGAYEAITLQMADTAYWHALGIQDSAFQPGLDPVTWGGLIGLNPIGVNATAKLTPVQVATFFSNLHNLQRGYLQTGSGTFRIAYPAADEAAATFAGDNWNGQPFFTNNRDVQRAIIAVYQFYNQIRVDLQGTHMVLKMPSLLGTQWFSYTTSTHPFEYSLDGGATWQSTSVLDTRNLANASPTWRTMDKILVKVSAQDGVTMSFNQLLPNFGGSLALGELEISAPNGQVTVNRINIAG